MFIQFVHVGHALSWLYSCSRGVRKFIRVASLNDNEVSCVLGRLFFLVIPFYEQLVGVQCSLCVCLEQCVVYTSIIFKQKTQITLQVCFLRITMA